MTTRKKWLKKLIISFISSFLICVVIFVVLGFYLKSRYEGKLPAWPEKRSDVRLEPMSPFIAKAEVTKDNGYFYIMKMNPKDAEDDNSDFDDEFSEFSEKGYRPSKFPVIEARCELHKENFELLKKASQCDTYVTPYKPAPGQEAIEVAGESKFVEMELSKCISYLCQKGIYEKQLDVAIDYLNASLVNSFCKRGKVNLLGGLVNSVVQKINFEICCRVANSPSCSTKNLKRLLSTLHVDDTPLGEPLRHECRTYRNMVPGVYRDLKQSTDKAYDPTMMMCLSKLFTSYDPKVTTAHFDAIFSHMINDMNDIEVVLGKRRHLFDLNEWIDKINNADPLCRLFDADPIGRMLAMLLVMPVDSTSQSMLYDRNHLAATKLFLAVKLFERERGALPERVEDLVPTYLKEVPLDLFYTDGRKIRYEKHADGKWRILFKGEAENQELKMLYISPSQFSPIPISGPKKKPVNL